METDPIDCRRVGVNDKNRTVILLALLNERYSASHHMRERSLSFTIWVSGFGVATIWFILNSSSLASNRKWLLTCLLAGLTALSLYFVGSIHRGFVSNRQVMINIERALGCYDPGIYLESKALFPPKYENQFSDTTNHKRILSYLNGHFVSLYIWIIILAVTAIVIVWFQPT